MLAITFGFLLNSVGDLIHQLNDAIIIHTNQRIVREAQNTSNLPLTLLFSAIAQVETNGNPRVGKAGEIGTYQIRECYWIDSNISGNFQQCWDDEYAERVMWAYWLRYCPDACRTFDFETMARIHNGGPKGDLKEATKPYWEKVKAIIAKG